MRASYPQPVIRKRQLESSTRIIISEEPNLEREREHEDSEFVRQDFSSFGVVEDEDCDELAELLLDCDEEVSAKNMINY